MSICSAGSAEASFSAPPPWRAETNFNDALYEWMRRAPWLAISAAAHVLLFVILMAIPWDLLRERKETVIVTELLPDVVEAFEPPPEEPEPPIDETLPDEPQLVSNDNPAIEDPSPSIDDLPLRGDEGELDDAVFDHSFTNVVIGVGPGASGAFGHFGPRGRGRGPGSAGTERTVGDGLKWLVAHQSPDGSWDSDGFSAICGKIGPTNCGDPGEATHDVGMTGLSLLAFLGDGHTTREGAYRDVVARAVAWLKRQQDPDTGLFGEKIGHSFLYDHTIATLAICEAYYFSGSPLLRRCAQDAVNYISTARNPYSAWRYDVPPTGANDTSVTGWMVFALKSAEEGGLAIDPDAYRGALSWFDEATDPASGRCGYDSIGSVSSRIPRLNDHFPVDRGEAMTAVALLCRFFLGQEPDRHPIMRKHAQLLRAKPPRWDPDGFGTDMYYWYYGAYAMYQMGGDHWEAWNKAMKAAVIDSQRRDGDEKGSWDPFEPWGFAGGRVYSTALMAMCLEVYFRYGKLIEDRGKK